MTPLICSIYRSQRKEGMYLYVQKSDGLDKVPEQLKGLFGPAELAMTMLMSEKKPLARVDVKNVIDAIRSQGFFLQMPPAECQEMTDLAEKNTKLQR